MQIIFIFISTMNCISQQLDLSLRITLGLLISFRSNERLSLILFELINYLLLLSCEDFY